MEAKYHCEDLKNRNHKNNSTVKRQIITNVVNKSYRDFLVFEEDENETEIPNRVSSIDKHFNKHLYTVAQIKQEITDEIKQEPHNNVQIKQELHTNVQINKKPLSYVQINQKQLCHVQINQKPHSNVQIKQEPHSNLQIKQEPHSIVQIKQELHNDEHIELTAQELNIELEDLYADHEVKEEMVLGPVVLQRTGSNTINDYNPDSPKSNMEHGRPAQKKFTTHVGKIKKEYKQKRTTVKHIAEHKTREQIDCNENITSRKNYIKIISQESEYENNNESMQKYVCDICEKVFKTRKTIIKHLRKHSSEKKGKFVCRICDKCFSFKTNLLRHKVLHNSNRKFICDICNKHFKVKYYLGKHLRSHAAAGPQFVCDCGKSYYYKSGLNYHMQYSCSQKSNVGHTGYPKKNSRTHLSALTKCELCKKQFAHVYLLKRHEQRTHNCHICKTTYIDKVSLITHKLTHNKGEPRLFHCELCKKTYISKYNLKRHMMNHSKNKPFACDLCGKRFYRKYFLTDHKKTHCS